MKTWISLLRGINVGGNNILPMKDLRTLLEGLNCENVQTYIQSGNCVYQSPDNDPAKLSTHISSAIKGQFGFEPPVITMSKTDLDQAISTNPYPQAIDDPKNLHLSFLFEKATTPDLAALFEIKKPSEAFTLTDKIFYLFAPDGIGRSKLATKVELKVGVKMTSRNYRTALKLQELASKLDT